MTSVPRVVWPFVLLVGFVAAARYLPDHAGRSRVTVDCTHIASDDPPALERCAAVRPFDVELMTDLGSAYQQAAQWDRAEAAYRRALAIDRENGDVRIRLGELLLRRGDAAGARAEGAAALRVQPGRLAALDLVRRASADEHR